MKISIVIPNWNGVEKLKRNLPKVLEVARLNKVEEIIVSDDASTDNSVEILKSQFPEVTTLVSNKRTNLGFSSNVNVGVSKAKGDLVVLLNTDAFPQNDFLKAVIPSFENPQVFSVGCNVGGIWNKAVFKDGYFWHSQAEIKPEEKMSTHKTLWVSGGSGIFRRSVWDEMSGLDTLFDPFYLEDLDLGYRAWKRGYINLWEPKSLVEHYKEKGVIESNYSQEKVFQTAERNLIIFIWKNIHNDQMIAEHKKALLLRLVKHPGYMKILGAALMRLPQIMAKRKIEKENSKLTDEEVFRIFT